MNAVEFVNKVREMRAAQKRYFTEGRKQSDLFEAKRLEKIVDQALKEGVTVREFSEPEIMSEDAFQERMALLETRSPDEPDAGDLAA